MQKYLIEELKSLNIKCRNKPSLNEVHVQCNFQGLFKILHEVKTVESIKIQIGNDILARNERELEDNLKKLPFHAYIPQDLDNYQVPNIKCKSFRSNLFHENLVSDIVEKYIRLTPIRREYAEMKKLGVHQGQFKSQIAKEQKSKKKLISELKAKLIEARPQEQQVLLENQDMMSENGKKIQENLSKMQQSLDNIKQQHIEIYKTLPKIPDLSVYLQKNKMKALMNITDESLHKHGFKPHVNWAPIKESIVAAAFLREFQEYQTFDSNNNASCVNNDNSHQNSLNQENEEVIQGKSDLSSENAEKNNKEQEMEFSEDEELEHEEDAQKQNNVCISKPFPEDLKIWDPFCGSGTLILELLHMVFNLPVRTNMKFEYFDHWKLFNKEEYEDYMGNLISTSQSQALEKLSKLKSVKIIASDIEAQSINYTSQNFQSDKLIMDLFSKDYAQQQQQQSEEAKNTSFTQFLPHILQYNFFDKVHFMNTDFEVVYKQVLKQNLEGFTIITNLPYNERSKDHISIKQLVNSFERFSKILKSNLKKLKDVYVFTTIKSDYNKTHFLTVSGLNWELVGEFNSGPLHIGLFKLIKSEQELEEKITGMQAVPEQSAEAEERSKKNVLIQDDREYTQQSLDLLKNEEKIHKVNQIVRMDNNHNHKYLQQGVVLQQRDLDLFKPKMPPQIYEEVMAQNKKENIQQMKRDFLDKFGKTKAVVQSMDFNLPKNLERKIGRKVVHEKRMELVQRKQLNEMLTDLKDIHNKKQELIKERSAITKQRIAKRLLKSVSPTKEQAEKIQEKIIEATNEKLSHNTLRKKQLKNKDKIKQQKIPHW